MQEKNTTLEPIKSIIPRVLASVRPAGVPAAASVPSSCWCGSLRCGCKPHGWVVNAEKKRAIRTCCSRWRCPVGAKYKRYKLRSRLNRVRWLQFLTLTIAGPWDLSPEYLGHQAHCVNLFFKAVRERVRRSFRYVWVRERGDLGGRLHIHILWTAGYIAQDWLSATAETCGLGRVLDVRSALSKGYRNSTITEHYVSKTKTASYVSKTEGAETPDRGFPSGTRIVQTSGVPEYESQAGWVYQELEPEFAPKSPLLLLHLSLTAKVDERWRRWVSERLWAEPARVDTGLEGVS